MAVIKEKSTFGYTPEQYKKFRKNGILFLVLFSLLYCTLYCTRNNLSAAAVQMMDELGWTTANIGLLKAVLFWSYGIGQLVSGRLCEIVGTNKLIILCVVLSASTSVIAGFQSELWVIAVLWAFNGFFQSMAWTPGLAAITKWWPGSSRGFAMGYVNAFSGFAGAFCQISVVFALKAAPDLGWRAAAFIPAAFPVAMLIIFVIATKASPEKIGLPEYKEDDPVRAAQEAEMREIVKTKGALYPFKYVLSNKSFIIWIIVAFVTGVARYGLCDWVPVYFNKVFGIDVTSGLIQSLVLPVGMGVGTLVLPALTDVIWKNNRLNHVILSAVVGAATVATFLLLDPRVPTELVLIEILLFVAGFFIYAINGITWAYASDIGGRVFSGTSSGILNFCCYMGSAIQSIVYGFLLETCGWTVVFISIASFCLLVAAISAITVIAAAKKHKKVSV